MLFGGDIYELSYDDIKKFFKNHSSETKKKGRASDTLASSSSSNISIKGEILNMME